MPSEIALFLEVAREQGVGIAALSLVVMAWLKGWVVSAGTHKEIVARIDRELLKTEEDRDWWRRAWEQAANVALESQEVAKETLRPGTGRRPRGEPR
jgi:tripartite-type tricarboxylate transporter receptor subunit TctC